MKTVVEYSGKKQVFANREHAIIFLTGLWFGGYFGEYRIYEIAE